MSPETWTISNVLDWTTGYFQKNNIESPHLEAEILLAHALNTQRINLYLDHDKELKNNELAVFKGYIQRRIKREPTAYITGKKPFMSLDLIVTKDVLIPRPETELLVGAVIDISRNIPSPSILDIGTGSGAIAISIAKYIEKASIVATDISESALTVAKQNAAKHRVENRIAFEKTDLFPKIAMKFNIIVSNPPYIRSDDIPALQPEIVSYEPVSALDGGKDGLDIYRKILMTASLYMESGSNIIFEVGIGQSGPVASLMKEELSAAFVEIKKDLNGIDRVVSARI